MFLDFLKTFGGLLFVDHAFSLTILDITHDLVMSLLLLLVLSLLLSQLKFEEFYLLLRYSLILLEFLPGDLKILLSQVQLRLELTDLVGSSLILHL